MRADGKKLKNADPMYTIAAYVMDKRYDAMNMITVDVPIDPLNRYVKKMRENGTVISHMGIILAAYLRVASQYPMLNRFVVNKRIYARNEFSVGMVVLKNDTLDGTMSKIYFDMEDTIFDVQQKMDKYINENRELPENNKTEKMIKGLLCVPGLCNVGVGLFKFMDKHGLLPKSIIDASPFHTSLLISNLASIRTNHIYHHCYEFGTTSIALTMGNMREVPTKTKDGVDFVRCIPIGVVMDERICSGSHFAVAFRLLEQYLKKPELLEVPPEKVEHDEV